MGSNIAWPKLRRSLVAILRGITPDESVAVVGALIEEGYELIEVPLNSPDAFTSIRRCVRSATWRLIIGFGRVAPCGALGAVELPLFLGVAHQR